ncbi:hypothetical protein QZM81_19350 [Burkholderia cepacia]|uniref:hypothetical protein n=1 Tax=Burkholderia cepacia TaxID=292 RepID=UPI00264DE117|nr:hypothetical protein [Burkholderia cepacia]MDN7857963.1 hypothetical protein [Burkholderia cepacia]
MGFKPVGVATPFVMRAATTETDQQRKKRERDERAERKALVAHWVEQANVRHVPGAVTFGNHLWARFNLHHAANWDADISEPQFLAALRSVLGKNLATRWRGRRGYLAVLADDAQSNQTGVDLDLLPGFNPAPPTDAERKAGWWPITRMRLAIRQAIADGCLVASTPYGPLMVFDGNAWRPVDDALLRAAFSHCYNVCNGKSKPMSDAHYRHVLDLTFNWKFVIPDAVALPAMLLARNATLTIAPDGRMNAYPLQPVPGMNSDESEPAIDWLDVDPTTREYRPAVTRDAEYHVLVDLFDGKRVVLATGTAAIDAAHVRYETCALLQAVAETEAAPTNPAPRRARL